eukprot:6466957-Amphidinium_carterae.1
MKSMKCAQTCARTRSESVAKHVLPSSYVHWVQHLSQSYKQHVLESDSARSPEPLPDAYPTDAVMRAKARTKHQDEPKTRKRRTFKQEEHYDDCGSDTGPITPILSSQVLTEEAMYLGPPSTFSLTHLCHSMWTWSEQSEQHAQSTLICLAFPKQCVAQTSMSRDLQEQAYAYSQIAKLEDMQVECSFTGHLNDLRD